jgi:hypothetical protein
MLLCVKYKSRFTEITTKIEDWKSKFVIFENFTNHGEPIRDINRGSREVKKYDGRGNSDYPNHRSWKKWWKRETKIHAWQWKGELLLGSHEIAMWKLCELMSNIEEQLCIVFMYTGNLSIISTISQFESDSKMCTFHLIWSAFVYDVWTTDLGFCQVSLLTHFPWQG